MDRAGFGAELLKLWLPFIRGWNRTLWVHLLRSFITLLVLQINLLGAVRVLFTAPWGFRCLGMVHCRTVRWSGKCRWWRCFISSLKTTKIADSLREALLSVYVDVCNRWCQAAYVCWTAFHTLYRACITARFTHTIVVAELAFHRAYRGCYKLSLHLRILMIRVSKVHLLLFSFFFLTTIMLCETCHWRSFFISLCKSLLNLFNHALKSC